MAGDGVGEALQFVGHDTPQHAARLQCRDEVFHAGKPAGVIGDVLQVIGVKRFLQGGQAGVIGQARIIRGGGKGVHQHRARAVPGVGQDGFRRRGRVAVLLQGAIDGGDEIGRGVEQRAVEVKPHRLIGRAHALSLRAAKR